MTHGRWTEVGERVFVGRYRFFDQDIGAILTDDGPVVIDTRLDAGPGARDPRRPALDLTPLAVAAVVDTHHHYDHAFGNALFRPAPIWGHVRCAAFLREHADDVPGGGRRGGAARDSPTEVLATEIDPPDRTFGDEGADLEIGGRRIELRYLGRGHTDDDIVIAVPDASVVFAGDLVENGAPPYFGDGFPLDWPDTVRALRPLAGRGGRPGPRRRRRPRVRRAVDRRDRRPWRISPGESARGELALDERRRRRAVPGRHVRARRSSEASLRRAASSTRPADGARSTTRATASGVGCATAGR